MGKESHGGPDMIAALLVAATSVDQYIRGDDLMSWQMCFVHYPGKSRHETRTRQNRATAL